LVLWPLSASLVRSLVFVWRDAVAPLTPTLEHLRTKWVMQEVWVWLPARWARGICEVLTLVHLCRCRIIQARHGTLAPQIFIRLIEKNSQEDLVNLRVGCRLILITLTGHEYTVRQLGEQDGMVRDMRDRDTSFELDIWTLDNTHSWIIRQRISSIFFLPFRRSPSHIFSVVSLVSFVRHGVIYLVVTSQDRVVHCWLFLTTF